MSKLNDVHETEIAFAAFDAADIIAVKIGSLGQLFLGEALSHPQFADAFTEQDAGVLGTHVPNDRDMTTMKYLSIGIQRRVGPKRAMRRPSTVKQN